MNGHCLLLYRDQQELADILAANPPDADRPVVLAGDAAHHDLLPGRPTVLAPRPDVHTRPAAAIGEYGRLARGPATVVAQPDPGRTVQEWARAARCEAALDLTGGATIICAYPAAMPQLLRSILVSTHAVVLTRDGPVANPRHDDPAAVLTRHTRHRPVSPPSQPPVLRIAGSASIGQLHYLRQQIAAHLPAVPTLIRTDFVAAVNEILTNGYLHGAPPLHVTLWAGDQTIDCRVTDHGPGRPDPTAGYRTPGGPERAGAGLWLARQLCDDIDMWRGDGTFTVRAATSTAPHRTRQLAGAHARAETARMRAARAAARSRLWSPSV